MADRSAYRGEAISGSGAQLGAFRIESFGIGLAVNYTAMIGAGFQAIGQGSVTSHIGPEGFRLGPKSD